MLKTIRTAALSAVVGLGGFAAMPAPAQATDIGIEFRFGSGGHYGYYDRGYYKKRRTCTENRALNKAERMGLRRVYVRNNNRNRIRVEGRKHGDRVRVTFAKAAGCPVIAYR